MKTPTTRTLTVASLPSSFRPGAPRTACPPQCKGCVRQPALVRS